MNLPAPPSRRVTMVLLAGLVLVSAGTVGAVAQDSDKEPEKEVRIVDKEITIADGVITIKDTTLRGPGLPDESIEERRYTLEESTVRFDGFHVTVGDTQYTFCRIVINVDDIGLALKDVQIGNG